MKVLLILFSVMFCFFSISNCTGEVKTQYEVIGLTDEIYYRFCGIWYFKKDIMDRTHSRYGEFSWGKDVGVDIADPITLVDLGNKSKHKLDYEPPMIIVASGYFQKVLSVEELDNDVYKINVHGTFDDGIVRRERDGYYLFHFVDEEAFWIERDIPLKSDFTGPNYIYYRISGPKKPKR
jgi:hypothetical protein